MAGQVPGGAVLSKPLMQSMCSLRHQCHSHGSLPHPAHHCTARVGCSTRAPLACSRTTALLVRDTLLVHQKLCVSGIPSPSGLKCHTRPPDAGSCTHSHFHMRVRAPIPTPICGFAQPSPTHTCKPVRAAFSTPGFPAAPSSYSRFPGRNGRHRAGIRRETWNPHRKRQSPRTQKGSTTCAD